MTPEDTPRMAERTDRQAQIDPWDSVHEEFADMSQWETARVYRADAVDAARAADAALLRERDAQIASLTAQVEQQEQELAENAARLRRMLSNRYDADNATLRAERDAAQQENQTLEILLGQASQASMLNRRAYFEEHDKLTALREALAQARQYVVARIDRAQDTGHIDRLHDLAAIDAALSSSPRPQEPQPSCDCHLRERQVCDICQRPSAPDHSTSQEPGGHQP